ncbi:ADP-ribosylglycohydrolase [Ignavibacterium album JCM 16511]|uniref:ADP-ribosylglycohydrolase n=1 Tax=Ignavibacterium album (strain DSM 19864 / JCM 16511 / NBRC 101810 / Mat9-16) TaxID=945713 RepID=I0AKY7_IGNAJ|nr:ADP-ribosylglycohydrolase family protein [Ignavibacterium album]AFH49644.1 ADP-ribosylglycohydrolase [Ignavibacterium album JCM 16511]
MLGAIAGDIIGSIYEFDDYKPDYDFPLFSIDSHFTDDTILTVALADSILNHENYRIKLYEYYHRYPYSGYGGFFRKWANVRNAPPYNSYGNGSAMRVSPVAWAYNDLETVLVKAKESAEVTHNHPEGIKGAQATASAIFLARSGSSKSEIKDFIEKTFGYFLDYDLEILRSNYTFNETCQNTVPQAIYTFLISENFEDSIRKAIYIGGDSDTLACINGSIAEAFYEIPQFIINEVIDRLDKNLLLIVNKFREKFVD